MTVILFKELLSRSKCYCCVTLSIFSSQNTLPQIYVILKDLLNMQIYSSLASLYAFMSSSSCNILSISFAFLVYHLQTRQSCFLQSSSILLFLPSVIFMVYIFMRRCFINCHKSSAIKNPEDKQRFLACMFSVVCSPDNLSTVSFL